MNMVYRKLFIYLFVFTNECIVLIISLLELILDKYIIWRILLLSIILPIKHTLIQINTLLPNAVYMFDLLIRFFNAFRLILEIICWFESTIFIIPRLLNEFILIWCSNFRFFRETYFDAYTYLIQSW